MNAALLGLSKAQIEERLDAIFAFADIGGFVDQPVKTYSSGMYVRLAFAVIAHVDADVLVIDEALAVGDAFFTQKCMRFLRAFMERGTVLFVSHDTNAVVNLCTRVVWLDKGRVREIGPAKDVCDSYLEAFYEEQHRASGRSVRALERSSVVRAIAEGDMRDQRALLINASKLRNDVELFQFTADAKNFGLGGASIEHVGIEDGTGAPLNWVVGARSFASASPSKPCRTWSVPSSDSLSGIGSGKICLATTRISRPSTSRSLSRRAKVFRSDSGSECRSCR